MTAEQFVEGQLVRVTRHITAAEAAAWTTIWADEMDGAVGQTGVIVFVDSSYGPQINFAGAAGEMHMHYYFPAIVLEAVSEGPLSEEEQRRWREA